MGTNSYAFVLEKHEDRRRRHHHEHIEDVKMICVCVWVYEFLVAGCLSLTPTICQTNLARLQLQLELAHFPGSRAELVGEPKSIYYSSSQGRALILVTRRERSRGSKISRLLPLTPTCHTCRHHHTPSARGCPCHVGPLYRN